MILNKSGSLIFAGLSLSGGKSDRASVAILEYYPEQKRIFLAKIFEKIKSEENISADLKIYEILNQYRERMKYLCIDVPWRLPNCLTCQLPCPGYESCQEPHILWMWEKYRVRSEKKRPKRLFTPYTQRAIDSYLLSELEQPFVISHALGSNMAPLLARAYFLKRRFMEETIEVLPELTMWRIGRQLGITKTHLKYYNKSATGHDSRKVILASLARNEIAFFYDADLKILLDNNHAFEAFLCAYTGFLSYSGQTEPRPKGFPETEDWIEFPKIKSKLIRGK